MMGGFSRLLARVHFTNFDKNVFSQIMQGSFDYTFFRSIAGRFRGGSGIDLKDDNEGQYSILPHSWNKMFEKVNIVTTDNGVVGEPYFFREMSGTMEIEFVSSAVYRIDKNQVKNDMKVRYETSDNPTYDPASAHHRELLILRTTSNTDDVNPDPEIATYEYTHQAKLIYWDNTGNQSFISLDPPVTTNSHSFRIYYRVSIMPMDMAVDESGVMPNNRRPEFLIHVHVRIGWNGGPATLKNFWLKASGGLGDRVHLNTRWGFNTRRYMNNDPGYANNESFNTYSNEIKFHNGAAGIQDTFPFPPAGTPLFHRYQNGPAIG